MWQTGCKAQSVLCSPQMAGICFTRVSEEGEEGSRRCEAVGVGTPIHPDASTYVQGAPLKIQVNFEAVGIEIPIHANTRATRMQQEQYHPTTQFHLLGETTPTCTNEPAAQDMAQHC